MKTKMFATVLAVIMLMTMVIAAPVSAADKVVLKGSEVVVPLGTTEAEVTVSVTGLPADGIVCARFNTRVEGAEIISGAASADVPAESNTEVGPTDKSATDGVMFMWANASNAIKADTALVTFKVAIPAGAKCGTEYKVIITPTDDVDDFIAADGLVGIGATAEEGKIVVGHSAVHVPAVEATPDANGNIEYWKCDKCEKLFSDEACTTEITAEDTVTEYVAPPYTLGDVNGDGSINAKDISAIMKHSLGNTPEKFILEAADMNGDGSINAKDITAIMRWILNH